MYNIYIYIYIYIFVYTFLQVLSAYAELWRCGFAASPGLHAKRAERALRRRRTWLIRTIQKRIYAYRKELQPVDWTTLVTDIQRMNTKISWHRSGRLCKICWMSSNNLECWAHGIEWLMCRRLLDLDVFAGVIPPRDELLQDLFMWIKSARMQFEGSTRITFVRPMYVLIVLVVRFNFNLLFSGSFETGPFRSNRDECTSTRFQPQELVVVTSFQEDVIKIKVLNHFTCSKIMHTICSFPKDDGCYFLHSAPPVCPQLCPESWRKQRYFC